MNIGTNLLRYYGSPTRLGLTFIFASVVSLGLALVASGIVVFVAHAQKNAYVRGAPNAYRAASIIRASSNEKANPSLIGIFLGKRNAGAILENATYAAASEAPPEGPVAIYFTNPTSRDSLPSTVQYPGQKITIETDHGAVTACTPSMRGGRALWVDQSGSTYFEPTLSIRARRC